MTFNFAERHYGDCCLCLMSQLCLCAECRYGECCYAECCGAFFVVYTHIIRGII
jgi:hypothetical protein